MDINSLRSLFTVLAFLAFVGIVWWAYSAQRKVVYDEAAQIPLEDDPPAGEPQTVSGQATLHQSERKST